MKPVCYPCNEFIDENSLSTLFGKDYAENLVYELYNPNDEKIENSKISELSQKYEQEFHNDPQNNNLDILNDPKDEFNISIITKGENLRLKPTINKDFGLLIKEYRIFSR